MRAAVRNADQHALNAHRLCHLLRASLQKCLRSSTGCVANLDVAPANAASPAGAQCFKHCLFRSPATGEVLRSHPSAAAVFDLQRRVHAAHKELAVPLDHLRNPQTLRNVGADAQHVHERLPAAVPRASPQACRALARTAAACLRARTAPLARIASIQPGSASRAARRLRASAKK